MIADDISDDNPDDSCTSNYAHDSPKTALSCLVTRSARSWQSGGQGRAVVASAVSWSIGYRRAGGHRLFTANDPEPTGIAQFRSAVRDSQSGCRTVETGNNRNSQDLRIGNPLVAGSSPARPTSERFFRIFGLAPHDPEPQRSYEPA